MTLRKYFASMSVKELIACGELSADELIEIFRKRRTPVLAKEFSGRFCVASFFDQHSPVDWFLTKVEAIASCAENDLNYREPSEMT